MKHFLSILFFLSGFGLYGQGAKIVFEDDLSNQKRVCREGGTGDSFTIAVLVTPGNCDKYQLEWGDGTVAYITGSGTQRLTKTYNISNFNGQCSFSTQNYTLAISSTNSNCSDLNFARLIINKKPIAIPIVKAACEGKPISFANGSCGLNNAEIKWKWEFSDGSSSTSQTPPNKPFSDQTGPFWVKLSATTSYCNSVSQSAQVPINLNKLPVSSATVTGLKKDDLYCFEENNDSTLTLDASASTNTKQFQWRISGGDYAIKQLFKPDSSVMQIKLKQTSSYTITFTAKNECGDAAQIFTKPFKALSFPEVSLVKQEDGCQKLDYQVKDPVPGAIYTLDGAPLGPTEVRSLNPSEKPYIIRAELKNDCGIKTDEDTLYVTTKQDVSIVPVERSTLCVNGDPVPLHATPTDGIWKGEGVQEENGVALFQPDKAGKIPVFYQRGEGECFSEDKVEFTVLEELPQPSIAFEATPDACSPALVKFTTTSDQEGADQWFWEIQDDLTSKVVYSTNVQNPQLPLEKGQYTIKLTAKKSSVCESQNEKTAALNFLDCKVDIPEAFTPNGDNFGDYYTFFGNGIDRILFLKVRDRWGDVVFEIKDVPPGEQSPQAAWNGTFRGKNLPADMYIYEARLRYRDKTESDVLKGNFYLVR